jgi:hypothetical protein
MDKQLLKESLSTRVDDTSPFLSREYVKLKDQSQAGNYASNVSVFESVTLSNGGRWCDYPEAFFTIPVMYVITGANADGTGVVDWTAEHISDSDFALGLKNSHINLINSCAIEYGNRSLVQATDYINDYLIFKQHTEMSEQDEILHGSTIGYNKDKSTSWYYDPVNGVCNNNSCEMFENACCNINIKNDGLRKRQEVFKNIKRPGGCNYSAIFGDNNNQYKADNGTYIENTSSHKVYYKSVIIKLKDLPVFSQCPNLMKGANFKITLTLNQCMFKFKKTTDGLEFIPSSFSGKQTNPMMIASPYFQTRMPNDAESTTQEIRLPSGSWTLPNDKTYTVSCNVGKANFAPHVDVPHCKEMNIELHVPVVELKPAIATQMVNLGQKRVVYNEVLSFVQTGKNESFNDLITNGVSHMKRMIIIPVCSSAGNGSNNVSPHLSPFDTVPSTCSPCSIENFQVQVANKNIYASPINYSYESFMLEMNGKYGTEYSMYPGLSSSRISLTDYVNNYGYIVVDLKRKHSEDESVPLSVQISGNITSLKKLDFYIFIETEKSFTYNVETGQRL